MIMLERDYCMNKRFVSTVCRGVLLANGWTNECPYKQTVYIEGVTYDSTVDIVLEKSMTLEEMVAFRKALIVSVTQGLHSITVKSYGLKPTIDIPFLVVITGGQERHLTNVSA